MRYCIPILWLSIIVGAYSCEPKPRESVDISSIPTSRFNELKSLAYYDGPIIEEKKDGYKAHYVKRDENLELKHISKSLKPNNPEVDIFLKGTYEFSVKLRSSEEIDTSFYDNIDTVFVTSDMEGNYGAFKSLLQANGVIDQQKQWQYGDNHLVLVGDMVDRGDEVLQVLWLIYKLEQEAKEAGGRVHFVLGNHEQMNLWGRYDRTYLNYVHPSYSLTANSIGIPYAKWIDSKSYLGNWLSHKNALVSIDSNLFVHGGIYTSISKLDLGLDQINELIRSAVTKNPAYLDRTEATLSSQNGPLWYRGLADRELSKKQVKKILERLNTQKIIIGHTIVDPEHISLLYDEQIIAIDMHHAELYKKSNVRGLLITESGYYEVDNRGKSNLLMLQEPIDL